MKPAPSYMDMKGPGISGTKTLLMRHSNKHTFMFIAQNGDGFGSGHGAGILSNEATGMHVAGNRANRCIIPIEVEIEHFHG
jgi:hypothetical protein